MAITMLAVLMIMAAYHPLCDLYPPSALPSHGYARSFEVGRHDTEKDGVTEVTPSQ